MKADIHLARTVPITELKAKIEQDENIPADQKNSAFAQAGYEKFKTLQKAIFEKRQELLEYEDEAKLWQVNIQEVVGKLRTEERAKYAEMNISYQPTTITKKQKTTKPVKQGKPSFSGQDKTELFEAAKKFDVPSAQVRAIMLSNHGWSAMKAAEYLHKLMNPA
jgi:hypothetical protein